MRRFLIVATAILFCAGHAFGKPSSVPLNLEQLAQRKFSTPPLTEAEKRVLQHASEGTVADCRDLGGGDDPAKADGSPKAPNEKWPASRNVRADLIRWLFVDREAREQVDPRGVRIQGARITGALDVSFTNLPFPLLLQSCRLEQDLNVEYAKMPALSLEGSWTGAIAADELNSEGSILLRKGFHAKGMVRLLGATIGGNLDADGGIFEKSKDDDDALAADRIKVTGNVILAYGFVAVGPVRLPGAEVKGQLDVEDAWLDELDLDSAHITGPFTWKNIHKDHHPDFPKQEWKPSLDLADAKVGPLNDQEASWPEKGWLRLDGFVYDRIAAGPTDAKARLRWLGLQPDQLGYLPQPYEQLIAVSRQMGNEDQVAEVAIAKQWDRRKHGHLGWLGWIQNWFLYLVVGYGYRPWLAFVWMAILVSLGTLVFSRARLPSVGAMVPSGKDAYEPDEKTEKATLPHYYQQFHPFVYSLDVILPFDLGQKSQWRLHERRPRDFGYWLFVSYSLFQLFIGWVLLLVAAAVPAGLIK